MILRRFSMVALAAALMPALAQAQAATRDDAGPIRPEALRAHLEFLADDRLEGREAGTRGYDLAALYVASRFAEMGLERAGTDGFFQHVPLQRAQLVPGSVALTVAGPGGTRRFADPSQVVAYPSDREAEERVEAPAVFAGYGIVAPEYGRDDYARLDVRGKHVVLLGGPPPGFPAEVAAHLGSTSEQRARAAERGATGVLFIYTPAFEARFPFARLPDVVLQPTLGWVDTAAAPAADGMRASVLVHVSAAAELFRGAPRTLDEVMREAATRAPDGFPLAVTATLERRATHRRLSSANVAGLLPGGDPRLAEEVVAVIGHLDHVGVGRAKDGDSIYNGAMDNAAGIAMMLEIARALFSAPGARPKRSVLFVAMTAEEKGLVGSDYFARNPTVAPGRIVGVINLDGAVPFYEFADVIGFGAENSTLGRSLARVAAGMGLATSPDPAPQLSIFTRSDHYSFVRRGVPAIFPQMGLRARPGGEGNIDVARRFSAEHLHQPSDDLRLPIDYAVLARYAEFLRRFTVDVADADERPRWYAGDFFGARFAPDAPKAPRD